MDDYWCILTTRYGAGASPPSEAQLREALAELFTENNPALTEDDYAEHPDAWVRLGKDEGPLYVVTITRERLAIFEQWADPDYETELQPAGRIDPVTLEQAFDIWNCLRRRDLAAVMAQPWVDD